MKVHLKHKIVIMLSNIQSWKVTKFINDDFIKIDTRIKAIKARFRTKITTTNFLNFIIIQ